jgi:S1-C subfamily serine protease
MKPRIDYAEEHGGGSPAEFALTEVIGVHETVDMALLRVAKKGGAARPSPLALDDKPAVASGGKVYVVGYPAWDGHRNEPEPMSRIFRDVYNVKRLQPGEVGRVVAAQKLFEHDCSTLGGNSGSCVVDLDTKKVIGLHFSGRFQQANSAVFLSKLQKDPLLRKAGVAFG